MTGSPTLVLLRGYRDAPDAWVPVAADLPDSVDVLTPELPGLHGGSAFTLGDSAAGVTAALDAAGHQSATFCGVGLGAMVAMQLAVDHPDRVDGLLLITRQVHTSSLLLSLPAAVLPLIPAAWVARLGAKQDQILTLLDQVRQADFSPLARQVSPSALVLCGAHDVINRRASATLARELPRGELQTVPHAGPGWLRTHPELLARALRDRLLA